MFNEISQVLFMLGLSLRKSKQQWELLSKITVAPAKCLEDQHSLLIQLKTNLTLDPEISTKLKMWNQSIACGNWNGVTCDSERQVIGLDLSAEYISEFEWFW